MITSSADRPRQRRLHVLVELLSSDLRTGAANDCLDLATFADAQSLTFTFCGHLDTAFIAEAHRRGAATTAGRSLMLSKRAAVPYMVNVMAWMRRLKSLKPDVVHLDYSGWAPSLACAAHFARTPVVGRAGGSYNPGNRANAWISAYAANCEPHAALLLASPLADRVRVTGSLFKADRLVPPFVKVREIPARQPGRTRFLFLGQIVDRKGVHVLVEAFSRVSAPADLLIAGGNWLEPGFPQEVKRQVARLGLSDRVFLEDFRTDAPALLDDCDVFVLPSLSDARPRGIIEAMYLGKPVVSTTVGGIPTLVQDGVTGLLVPPSDAGALAKALDDLASHPELRRRMGSAARVWSRSEVRPDHAAAKLADLYRGLAAR